MARSLSPSLLQLQQALLAGVRRVHCKTGFSETLNATLLTTWGLQRGQPWAQKWKTSCCLWLSSPVARIQFWQLAILQTTDIFICVCIIDYLPYRHTFPQNMSYNFHITCVLSDCHEGRWRWNYKQQGWRASDSSSSRHLNICQHETSRYFLNLSTFPAMFVATKTWYFEQGVRPDLQLCLKRQTGILRRPRAISSHVCGNPNRYFRQKKNVFLTLTKWFLYLNLTRHWAKRCHKRKL